MDTEEQPSIRTTVLIVSYNCAGALARCLESLEKSEGRETMEILVVDAGSRDEGARLDTRFEKITILRLPRHFGQTKARNIGTRTAKGKLLFLLSPDTEVLPETIPALADRLEEDTGVAAVSPLLTDPEGNPASQAGLLPTPAELYAAWCTSEPWTRPPAAAKPLTGATPVEVDCPDPRAILVRTQAVRGMNYFDERYGDFGSSLELPALAARAGRRILLIPAARAITHGGEGLWRPETDTARDDLLADYGHGIATYAGKHYGFLRGLGVRVRMILWALLRIRVGLLMRLASGSKIDGSQQGL